MTDARDLLRIVGLAIGTGALVRQTWALRVRAPAQRVAAIHGQFAASTGPRGATAVCTLAGIALVAAPAAWSLLEGTATIAFDWRLAEGGVVAVLATVAIKLGLVVFEELIFRAAVVRTLSPQVGSITALLIGAAAFAFAHGRDAMGTVILLADGIGFGVAYIVTGSLRAPIAWHAAKNIAVWLLAGESTVQLARGPLRLTSQAGSTLVTSADLVVTVVVVAATSAWLLRHRGRPGSALVHPTPAREIA